jgi:hypothetical protein
VPSEGGKNFLRYEVFPERVTNCQVLLGVTMVTLYSTPSHCDNN